MCFDYQRAHPSWFVAIFCLSKSVDFALFSLYLFNGSKNGYIFTDRMLHAGTAAVALFGIDDNKHEPNLSRFARTRNHASMTSLAELLTSVQKHSPFLTGARHVRVLHRKVLFLFHTVIVGRSTILRKTVV